MLALAPLYHSSGRDEQLQGSRLQPSPRAGLAAGLDAESPTRMPSAWAPACLSGGLFNQIYALCGHVLKAFELNASLALPSLQTHVTHGSCLPFGEVFDVQSFARSLAPHGVRVVGGTGNVTADRTAYHGRQFYLGSLRQRLLADRNPGPSPLEDATFAGLQPVHSLRRLAYSHVLAKLRPGGDFGCLHARVESDMRRWWPNVGGGRPPGLDTYLAQMSTRRVLLRTPRIFVAVGKTGLDERDEAVLRNGTAPWGARLIRSTVAPSGSTQTVHYAATPRNSSDPPGAAPPPPALSATYLGAALVDMLVCKEAAWFVGWSGSTFSLGMAKYRQILSESGEGSAQPPLQKPRQPEEGEGEQSGGRELWYSVCATMPAMCSRTMNPLTCNDSVTLLRDGGLHSRHMCLCGLAIRATDELQRRRIVECAYDSTHF